MNKKDKVIFNIGNSFNTTELKKEIKNFYKIYKKRPFKKNIGGMGASHMFAFYFILKKLKPKFVIESGVWRGASTWLIEKTLPGAKIISIDPNLKKQRYISKNASYFKKDFSFINWESLPKDRTVVFFDDHQNSLERIKQAKSFGFKHLVFDDNNIPAFRKGNLMGDFYSIKKILSQKGHFPKGSFNSKLKKLLWTIRYTKSLRMVLRTLGDLKDIKPNKQDRKFLLGIMAEYYEFPPLFKKKYTTEEAKWFRKDSLLPLSKKKEFNEFYDSRQDYNGLCYLRIK